MGLDTRRNIAGVRPVIPPCHKCRFICNPAARVRCLRKGTGLVYGLLIPVSTLSILGKG